MFPNRLSEATASEVESVLDREVAETLDVELKRSLPAKRGALDPWMTGGKLGDEAKDELAAEIIAFANTIGGTLIVGIDEDTATKRAKPPLHPVPRCKEAAARLHQAISDRVEPKLTSFECEGIPTEADGHSGVIVMRTLESYLAPHRHTQDNHCYYRRNDRAEPMSMLEIQEMTRRRSRAAADAEREFKESGDRFFRWIPEEHRMLDSRHRVRGIETEHVTTKVWEAIWAVRVTARPVSPIALENLVRQKWLADIDTREFQGSGQVGRLSWSDMRTTRVWTPRLRAVEREFEGTNSLGIDRIGSDGLIERFAWKKLPEERRQRHEFLDLGEFYWNVACVVRAAELIRTMNSRPTQAYGLEIELANSERMIIAGRAGAPSAVIAADNTVFPRYEISDPQSFDLLLSTIDKDIWNLGGHHPSWEVGLNWSGISPR